MLGDCGRAGGREEAPGCTVAARSGGRSAAAPPRLEEQVRRSLDSGAVVERRVRAAWRGSAAAPRRLQRSARASSERHSGQRRRGGRARAGGSSRRRAHVLVGCEGIRRAWRAGSLRGRAPVPQLARAIGVARARARGGRVARGAAGGRPQASTARAHVPGRLGRACGAGPEGEGARDQGGERARGRGPATLLAGRPRAARRACGSTSVLAQLPRCRAWRSLLWLARARLAREQAGAAAKARA